MPRTILLGVLLAVALAGAGRRSYVSHELLDARARWRAGDVAAARSIARAALPGIAREVRALPADPQRHMALAELFALSGEPQRALSEARAALAAHPAPVASPLGDGRGSLLESMAVVAMEAGATEEALDALEVLLAHGAPAAATALAADERLAPLRADQRWHRLLAEYGGGSPQVIR